MSGKPDQYDDLAPFIAEQELLHRLAGESRLPCLEVDVLDGYVPAAVEKVADWLEVTGGLCAAPGLV